MDRALLEKMATDFMVKVFSQLKIKNKVLKKNWDIDHLCFRTTTNEKYLFLKKELAKFSALLGESRVNGRPIATFKLQEPFRFKEWRVDLVELPAPKAGKITKEGFEHLEIVCDRPFDEIKQEYADCSLDESGLKKNFNKELEVSFGDYAIKFHHLSLASVVQLESQKNVFRALLESKILDHLKAFDPLVAGTFPLGVHSDTSDVDLLIHVQDFDFAKNQIIANVANHDSFRLEELSVQNERTLFVSFMYQGVPFEIFGQQIPAVRQRGYRHFLVEERLLKIGGEALAEKVKVQRNRGLKTEPAFAKVLEMSGDPYVELLTLQAMGLSELSDLFKL